MNKELNRNKNYSNEEIERMIKEITEHERDNYKQYLKEIEDGFQSWWHNVGSGFVPKKEMDYEEFGKYIARLAWYSRGEV